MANDPLAIRSYYGVLSPAFTTKQSLAALLTAAYAALPSPQTVPSIAGCEVNIYADDANGVKVLVGDENVSDTTLNYAYKLSATGSRRYGPGRMSAVPIADIYVMAADHATACKIGIEIIPT